MSFQFAKSFLSRAKMCPDWPGGDPRRHIPRSEGVRATQLEPTELSPSRHQPSNERPTHRPTLRVPHTCTISGTPTILPPILPAIILEITPTNLFYIWLNPSFTQNCKVFSGFNFCNFTGTMTYPLLLYTGSTFEAWHTCSGCCFWP